MLNRCFYCVLGLAASLAFGTVAAGQDAAPAPASLSTNLLMDEELAKPDAIKIDPALLTPPEDADADGYTVSGNVATNAGTYTATVALADPANTVWADATKVDAAAAADRGVDRPRGGTQIDVPAAYDVAVALCVVPLKDGCEAAAAVHQAVDELA